MATKNEIYVGDEAKDTITGFAGVVVSKTEWLNGCVRVQLQPKKLQDGKPVETSSFDIEQVTVTKSNQAKSKPSGGTRPDPMRRADPTR